MERHTWWEHAHERAATHRADYHSCTAQNPHVRLWPAELVQLMCAGSSIWARLSWMIFFASSTAPCRLAQRAAASWLSNACSLLSCGQTHIVKLRNIAICTLRAARVSHVLDLKWLKLRRFQVEMFEFITFSLSWFCRVSALFTLLSLSVTSELWTRSSSSPRAASSASTFDNDWTSSAFSDSNAASWVPSTSLDCVEEIKHGQNKNNEVRGTTEGNDLDGQDNSQLSGSGRALTSL